MSASRFDVVVAGGGFAGVAAALAAARLGARTLLVERDAALGGNATAALVHTICGFFEPAATEEAGEIPRGAHGGLVRRVVERLVEAGACGAPERAGRSFVLPTRPPEIAPVLGRLCAGTQGLEVTLGAEVVAAELAREGAATSVLALARGAERWRVEAAVLVDATGDANVAALGGADVTRAAPERLQHASFIFRVRGAPPEACDGFARLRLTAGLAGDARHGRLPEGCDSVLLRPGAPGEVYVTATLPKPDPLRFDPLDAAQRAELASRGAKAAAAIAAWLRGRPGWEASALDALPLRPGIRETRRLCGISVVEADDLRAGRRSADEVARSAWGIELWESATQPRFEPVAGVASIPLGALISRSHARLGAAGRCLSASHEAHGAIRVLATALATGEAAGTAAALAADRGTGLPDVAPGAVREAMARDGARELPS